MKRLSAIAMLSVLLLSCAAEVQEPPRPEWSSWRGPNQDGSFPLEALSVPAEVRLRVAWIRQLGAGYSSISASNGTAVTLYGEDDQDHLIALAIDNGRELWRAPIGATHPQDHPEATDGPLSTPAIHDGTVFALSSGGELVAARLADGTFLWSVPLGQALGALSDTHGFASSPAIIGGNLIVQTGAGDGRSTCALDPANGEVRWCTGAGAVGYQSPLEVGGHVTVASNERIQALDADSGELVWNVEHIAPVMDGYAQVVPLGEGRFLAHYLEYSAAYRIAESTASAEELWRTQELIRNLGAPVVNDGRIYGFLREQLVCLDALSGEMLWLDEEVEGRGLALLGNHLAIWGIDGTLRIARQSGPTVEIIARVETGLTDSYSAPSFADGHVLVRSLEGIAAIRLDARP